jgi:hypothetical protein
MIRRTILSVSALTFACTLFLAGCEESKTPPPADSKSPPSTPDKDKKTSAVTPPVGQTVAASLGQSSTDSSKALLCGMEGCSAPGNATKSLVRDGKTITFCSDGCLAGYKKANNIQ